MSDSISESRIARALRPATNWPATARDHMKMASFYRYAAGQQKAQAADRASRLATTFEELAAAAAEHERPVTTDPQPVFALPAESSATVQARSFAARTGWWPAWAIAGFAATLVAVPFWRVNRSTMPAVVNLAGVVTDSLCGQHHSAGSEAACVRSCVGRGAKYALYDGTSLYTLSDQRLGERFAARRVDVSGTLDRATKTLRVTAIKAVS